MLFMTKRQNTHPGTLGQPPEVSDGNTRDIIDGVDIVQLERINNKVKAVSQIAGIGIRLFHIRWGHHFLR